MHNRQAITVNCKRLSSMSSHYLCKIVPCTCSHIKDKARRKPGHAVQHTRVWEWERTPTKSSAKQL